MSASMPVSDELSGVVHRTRILVVGSGGNGISAAIQVRDAGFDDVTIITKHADFGGAWNQNTYPGCAVDLPITVYQFGFAITPEWSRLYAPQGELLGYIRKVAADHDLPAITHFDTEMLGATWSNEGRCWRVATSRGTYEAAMLVLATGFLEEMVLPDIAGADRFEGRMFHSSQWPAGYTGAGDRIAVVGSGSSSLQIVPEMQKVAAHVTVFQRTPCWVVPKNDREFSDAERAYFRSTPAAIATLRAATARDNDRMMEGLITGAVGDFQAVALRHLEDQVADPDLRRLLTPNHKFGCKRPGVSDLWYPALQQANVTLVAEAVTEIGPGTIGSTSHPDIPVDTIVLATGFYFGGHILDRIRRRDGRSVGAVQAGRPRAYQSVSVADCPNLFLVGGAGPNGQSWNGLACGEIAGRRLVDMLRYMDAGGIRALVVKDAAEVAWKQWCSDVLRDSVTVMGNCVNYSQDSAGDNKAMWPGTLEHMTSTLGTFDPTAYEAIT